MNDQRGDRGSRAMRRRGWRLRLASGAAVFVGSVVFVGVSGQLPAGALTHAPLTTQTATPATVVESSSGTAFTAWGLSSGAVQYCKVPQGTTCTHKLTLPIPAGAHWDNYSVDQPFPVLGGKPGVVSVVAPSYDYSDVVVWTSTDFGVSFSEPTVISNSHYDGTGADDVLRDPDADPPYYPDYFAIASTNPGLFFTFTGIGAVGALDPPAGFQVNTTGVPGSVTSSSLGYGKLEDPGPSQHTQTVLAFSTDADSPQLDYTSTPYPGTSSASLFTAPKKIAVGISPRLAGGPGGLYLLSADFVGNPDNTSIPLHLDIRKWNPTTKAFGSPTLIAKIPNDVDYDNVGGLAEDATTGALTVAWPMDTTGGGYKMEIWTSPHGITFSGPTVISSITGGYSGPARLATNNGKGFLTWQQGSDVPLYDLKNL